MKTSIIKKLWSKWWFFIPVSLILVSIVVIIITILIHADFKNAGKLAFIIWIGLIIGRYWLNKKGG